MRLPLWIRQHLAAVRALLVLTVVLGIVYPLAVWAVAQVPGLRDGAEGSTIKGPDGRTAGSSLIGQSFTDKEGDPLKQYFQSRPSATIDSAVKGQEAADPDDPAYNPTGSAAGNLGPEDIVDTLPDPALLKAGKDDENAKTSLLTTVCRRSLAIGALEGVDGSRPYCTRDGVGAVLSLIGPRQADGHVAHPTRVVSVNQECSDDPAKPVTPFIATYRGVKVECAKYGEDYKVGEIVPIRGGAPADPKVPADAVTASGSGLDPDISPAYARLQAPRIARTRGISEAQVLQAIKDDQDGRTLGFLGQPTVNVLRLNIELDREHPFHG